MLEKASELASKASAKVSSAAQQGQAKSDEAVGKAKVGRPF